MCTRSTTIPASSLRRVCLAALIAAAAVIATGPAANAELYVGGQKWSENQLRTFVNEIKLGDYLGKIREKFIPNLVHFMTENKLAKFYFKDDGELKTELISQYIDAHMKGLGDFQALTHDKRGADFINTYFKPNRDLKMADGLTQVKERLLTDPTWARELDTIIKLSNEPPADYMKQRPNGNLWIFRTMSRKSAQYIDTEFSNLRTQARAVAPLVAQGNHQAATEILDRWFSDANLEYALQGHFGDLFQALTYNSEVNGGDNVLVGFKIKNGAELVMYSPLVMILTGEHVDASKYQIAGAMLNVFGRANQGSGSDGIVKGYVSIKHEARGDFSFGLAKDKMSIVLFCLLVSDHVVYTNVY